LATDLHQHLWPEELIRALERRTKAPRLRGARLELAVEGSFDIDLATHDLDARLELLDRNALDVAVVSLPPTLETDDHEDLRNAYHDGIASVVADSGGRLLAFAAGERREGFAGACISASTLIAGCDPLLAGLERHGEILFVHPGPPEQQPAEAAPGWWAPVVEYTAQMQAAYAAWLDRDAVRYPRLAVVFAILAGGAPIQLERLRSRGVEVRTTLHPNGFFDTASYGRRALELCLSTFGVTQLVFGSDAPVIDPGLTREAVEGFGEAVSEIVLNENPHRLLGR
jgi:predicted TIM-barrel fold metal-dependent hydrolase